MYVAGGRGTGREKEIIRRGEGNRKGIIEGQDRTEHRTEHRTGHGRIRQDRTGQNMTKQDRTGQIATALKVIIGLTELKLIVYDGGCVIIFQLKRTSSRSLLFAYHGMYK